MRLIKTSWQIGIYLCRNDLFIFLVLGRLFNFCLIATFLLLSLKAGWKESHATFMTELRNLQATGLTTIGQSLRNAFDLLNLNRLVTGIDNYGQVCSTEEVEKKSGLGLTGSPHVLHIPIPLPVPSFTSINHPHTVTHTHIMAINEKTGATFCKNPWKFMLTFTFDLLTSDSDI